MGKNGLRILGVLLGITLLPSASSAGLLVEPYAGYQTLGSLSFLNSDAGSYNGFTMGARGGFTLLDIVFAAADFNYTPNVNFSSTSSSAVGSGTTNNVKLGVVAGVSIPLMPFRFWVGYNFLDKISDPTTTISGNSFKFGAGIKLIPLVSLNFEYVLTNYGGLSVNGVNTDATLGGNSVTGKILVFTASVPLSL